MTNDWVSISVKDSGCGIAKEDQTMIFEEFKQVNAGINREVGGTGLKYFNSEYLFIKFNKSLLFLF